MSETNFSWLQSWYLCQCDDDWEHGSGISIETLDNPGWLIAINLRGTKMNGVSFERFEVTEDEAAEEVADPDSWHNGANRFPADCSSWICCYVEDGVFHAACSPLLLEDTIQVFREWVTGMEHT